MKQNTVDLAIYIGAQPPSGGCVLKLAEYEQTERWNGPAAFGRLCVETTNDVGVVFETPASRLRAAVC